VIDRPTYVEGQYADEARLEKRRSVWQPTADGRDPSTVALDVVLEALPEGGMPDVLELGCGTGVFAARLAAARPGIAVLATDQSPRMVELTRSRGVPAQVMDAQALLAPDDSYDAVVALWMLYHVPSVDTALAEVRRVLRPGGHFVAVTNGDQHLAELRRLAGGSPSITSFSSENGEAALRRHFGSVEQEELATRAYFADRDTALGYLDSAAEDVAWELPEDGWPRVCAGAVSVFVAY
jgi:SAM-dependent methyltransferase